jgi:small subunit ribosomal protein S15
MSKQTEIKKDALKKAGLDAKNVGGTSEQITMLSARIDNLAEHLKTNRKDLHSTRGLLQLLANRRKLIKYLKRRDMDA